MAGSFERNMRMNSPSIRSTFGFVASWDSQRISFTDAEVSEFVPGEVLADQVRVDAAEVGRSVRQVTADVYLPVRVRDLVNNLEAPIIHQHILGFLVFPVRSPRTLRRAGHPAAIGLSGRGAKVRRALRAWPLAWPSPSGPLGRQRLRGQRRAVGASAQRDAKHR